MQSSMAKIGIMLLIIMLLACDETERPTRNIPPVIDEFLVPETLETGSRIQLIVVAHDANRDILNYAWSVDGGTLRSANTTTVWWDTPMVPAVYRVTVHVTDSINPLVKKTGLVTVKRKPEPVPITPTPPPSQYVPPIVSDPPPTPEPVTPAPKEEARIVPRQGLIMITPGKETVGVRIGDTLNSLKVLYGEPEPTQVGGLIFRSDRLGEFACGFRGDKVRSILTVDRRYKTVGGNGVGSRRADVLKEFGEPDERQGLDDYYHKDGIVFLYDQNQRVQAIAVFDRI